MFFGINEGGSKASAFKSFTSLTGRVFRKVSSIDNTASSLQRHGIFPGNIAVPWPEASSFHPNSLCQLRGLVHEGIYTSGISPPYSDGFAFRTLWQVKDIKAAFDQIPNVSVFSRVIWQLGISIPPSLINFLERI